MSDWRDTVFELLYCYKLFCFSLLLIPFQYASFSIVIVSRSWNAARSRPLVQPIFPSPLVSQLQLSMPSKSPPPPCHQSCWQHSLTNYEQPTQKVRAVADVYQVLFSPFTLALGFKPVMNTSFWGPAKLSGVSGKSLLIEGQSTGIYNCTKMQWNKKKTCICGHSFETLECSVVSENAF